VDREGLAALSMRRLGSELGVDPMAIYYHVPNKDALLDAIVEAVMTEIDLTCDDPSAPPEERALGAARAYRDVMLAHANALPIVLSRGPATPAALRPVELLVGILRDAGLPTREAVAGMNALASAVRGAVGMQASAATAHGAVAPTEAHGLTLTADEFPNLHAALGCFPSDLEQDFDFGIRALVRGLLGSRQER
jgi:AcrR family transcriptional regulator